MHPNAYLRNFWQSDFKPQIFVAMPFAPEYQDRFDMVIRPAIEAITHQGRKLAACRVDLSKRGDSIITEIIEGIARSEMVLADVSTVGRDSKSGAPYRNANVMYEVGLALACRQSSEVLIIRDDRDPLLFDISTIPQMHIDFSVPDRAKTLLAEEMVARLKERAHLHDARVRIALSTMTMGERRVLEVFAQYRPDQVFHLTKETIHTNQIIPRLLDKQLIVTVATRADGVALYRWTRLGLVVTKAAQAISEAIAKSEAASATPSSPLPNSSDGSITEQ